MLGINVSSSYNDFGTEVANQWSVWSQRLVTAALEDIEEQTFMPGIWLTFLE